MTAADSNTSKTLQIDISSAVDEAAKGATTNQKSLARRKLLTGVVLVFLGLALFYLFVVFFSPYGRGGVLGDAGGARNGHFAAKQLEGPRRSEAELVQLVQRLHANGFVCFGSRQCGYSTRQREVFGPRGSTSRAMFENLLYRDCFKNATSCKDVHSYPLWRCKNLDFEGGYRDYDELLDMFDQLEEYKQRQAQQQPVVVAAPQQQPAVAPQPTARYVAEFEELSPAMQARQEAGLPLVPPRVEIVEVVEPVVPVPAPLLPAVAVVPVSSVSVPVAAAEIYTPVATPSAAPLPPPATTQPPEPQVQQNTTTTSPPPLPDMRGMTALGDAPLNAVFAPDAQSMQPAQERYAVAAAAGHRPRGGVEYYAPPAAVIPLADIVAYANKVKADLSGNFQPSGDAYAMQQKQKPRPANTPR